MSVLDLPSALLLTQRLLGLGLLIQSVELFTTRASYAKGGVLEGTQVTPWLLARIGMAGLLVVSPFAPQSAGAVAVQALLLGSSVWLTVRSCGPVGGGSDSMFFQVQLGLLIASLGHWQPILGKLGLGWIAAQSVLSYFLAGMAKLRTPGWRDGRVVQNILAADGPYLVFASARKLAASRPLCAALGASVMLLELAFPAVLVLPMEGRCVLISLGFTFHFLNAMVLGLNRFIWAWAATYPAMLALGG